MLLKKNYSKYKAVYFGLVFLAFAFTVFFQSCKDTKDNYNIDYSYNYYPIDSGHYVIYEVDSILYTYNGQYTRDTARYQIKELITDTFYDGENNLCYRLETFKRYSSSAQWEVYKVWKIERTPTTLLKTEDDLKFVSLVFPPAEGEEWNGNIYLPSSGIYGVFQDWNYTYSLIHKPYSINGFSFDSTLTVEEIDDESLIEKRLRKQVYAAGVGMIYREWEVLTKQNVQKDWQDGPENGFRIRMRLIDHN